jgi:uncharacterized Zn-finger protein
MEQHYRELAKKMISKYGPLQRVEFLSHYPNFDIDFVYQKGSVHSGPRTGDYDINFLRLGYIGEGPRCARAFLDSSGILLSTKQIEELRPGAVIEPDAGNIRVSYPNGILRPTCWACGETIAEGERASIKYPLGEGGRGVHVHLRCEENGRERTEIQKPPLFSRLAKFSVPARHSWKAALGAGIVGVLLFSIISTRAEETLQFMEVAALICVLVAGYYGFKAVGIEPLRQWRVSCPYCGYRFQTHSLRDPEVNPTLTCPQCARAFRW